MNFSYFSFSDLFQQRQALEKAELAFKNQKQWIQKREEIEKTMLQLQEEMEHDFYQRHQRDELEEAIPHFQMTLEEKRNRLFQLREELFQIDEWLDQTEDLTEESLNQQRSQLLHAMWQLYPEKRATQEAKWKEWNHLRVLEIELLGIEKMLERLSEHLNIAIQARQSIKGRGILNYIFGLSPNMVIEKQLFGIHALILSSLPLFEKILYQNLHPSPKLLQDLLVWLEQLKNTCYKPWSFRHLDTLFSETQPILKQFLVSLREQQHQAALRIQTLNQEIQEWIQQL